MATTPEVDTTTQKRPGLGARVPGVRVSETRVSPPHDLVKLPELAKETRLVVVDPFGVWAKVRAGIALNVPQTVWQGATTSTGHFLLFRCPFRKLDFVGEKNTVGHNVDESELSFDGSEPLLSSSALGLALDDFDTEVVVGIAIKALETISRYFILPFLLAHRGADVVGM